MAFKIIWSRQARDDLREIVIFIAANNQPVAESFGFRLMGKVDLLAQFPQIGRVVPEERDESLREIILRPYRIIYRVLAESHVVAIARVWREARRKFQVIWNLKPGFAHGWLMKAKSRVFAD